MILNSRADSGVQGLRMEHGARVVTLPRGHGIEAVPLDAKTDRVDHRLAWTTSAEQRYHVTIMDGEQKRIEHRETAAHGEFTIGRDAIMTYRKAGQGHIEVNHTRVAREAQGKGLAAQLYRAMVEYARSRGLKVTATCSYVVKMFERFPEDSDVLKD